MKATNAIQRYQDIISKHPLFAELSPKLQHQLAQLFSPCAYTTNDIIVNENDLIDSIYFIVSGRAEVRKNIVIDNKHKSRPIAILKDKESIGLNDSGMFSPLGRRSATVIALTPLHAIRLDISQFRDFMQTNFIHDEQLSKSLQLITRMNFIKQLIPFSELSIEKLYSISEQINEINISAGTILFHQGDTGDACYLLQSGEADVIVKFLSGEEKKIAEIIPPNIIGEASLLTDTPRNATIKITHDARLLVFNKRLFTEITYSETTAADALMRLQHSRSRPFQSPGIEYFESKTSDDDVIVTLRNTQQGKYYQISSHGWFIWQTLNGENSLMDITYAYYEKYKIFDPEMISQFIVNLSLSGFVQLEANAYQDLSEIKLPLALKISSSIARFMEYRYAFGNADAWITNSYQKRIYLLYTKPFRLLYCVLVITGLTSFILYFPTAASELSTAPNKWALFFLASFSVTLTIPIHELAHAYTTKYYGRRVYCFGIGWFWVGPFAFCDTSDMWLCPPRQRLVVDLVGLYANIIIAGVAGILMYAFQDHQNLFIFFGLFALSNYLLVISNLYPGIELDGYYALMDAFDKPNLRTSALEWAIDKMKHKNEKQTATSTRKELRENLPEISYWLISIFYILLIETIVSYYVLHYLLYGLFAYRNPYINLVIVLLVVTISSLKLYGEVIKKKNTGKNLKIKH